MKHDSQYGNRISYPSAARIRGILAYFRPRASSFIPELVWGEDFRLSKANIWKNQASPCACKATLAVHRKLSFFFDILPLAALRRACKRGLDATVAPAE